MLWKEFVEETGCDCEVCPIKKNDLCNGASVTCYGGDPVYAPCCDFEDDLDLDEYIEKTLDNIRRYEEWEDKRIREEKAKKEKAKKAAETRKQMELYCSKEIAEIKSFEKNIKKIQKAYEAYKIRTSALNTTNEMFGYSKRYAEESPEVEKTLAILQEQLAKAKERYAEKRKEFYVVVKKGKNNVSN